MSFTAPEAVYATYGRLCFAVFLAFLIGLLGWRSHVHNRSSQSHTARAGRLEYWGFGLAWAGLVLNLMGNLGDYWYQSGLGESALDFLGFQVGTLLGLLVLAAGLALLGIGALRTGKLPRFTAWLLILWLPLSLALMLIGFNNLPSGPLLGLSVLWLVLGCQLLSRSRSQRATYTMR